MIKLINVEETFLLDILNSKPVEKYKDRIDWDILLDLLHNHKIFPYFYKYHNELIPNSFKERFEKLYLEYCELTKSRVDEVLRVARIIKLNNINATILKGIVLSEMLHGDTYSRKSYDIDILIEEDSVQKMHDLLEENGYIHGCGIENAFDTSSGLLKLDKPTMKAYKHHEYFEYYFEHEPGDYIELELQKSIHATITDKKLLKQFINSTQIVTINGQDIKTLDNEHTLLHLLESIYTDSEWYYRGPKLNKFLDIFTIISTKEIDWDLLKQLSVNYGMEGIVSYSLDKSNQIFENQIDENIMKRFDDQTHVTKPFTINWDQDIRNRLFTKDSERRNYIVKDLKTISHSNVNHYWKFPFKIDVKEKSSEFDLIDFKYQFKNKYMVYQDNDNLYFQIKLDDEMIKKLNEFEINIDFFDSDLSSPELIFEELRIYLNEKTFSYSDKSVTYTVSISEGDFIVYIPKKNLKLKDNKLSFLVGLEEKILPHFNYSISPNHYYDKEIWKSMPIVQL